MEETLDHTRSPIETIIALIQTLRGENGCPWDKKQTPQAICRYLIEESYELMDALQTKTPESICEELGDVLFLVLFLAVQFQEAGHFDIKDIVQLNKKKMIRRHPHVFGREKVDSPEAVRKRWTSIKSKEKENRHDESVLASVPKHLPALFRAYRISERAAGTGFDWHSIADVMKKVEEEWQELKNELDTSSKDADTDSLSLEFGDVLFTLVNVARFAGIHPETALLSSTQKFENRFKTMERLSRKRHTDFEALSFSDMHALWEEVKNLES